ncbi:MAG: D-aminoacylase [Deltaproteobacteria bacterium]|nr:D-aminoacylase [Deltaproteobacteria bacterium]MCL5793102.1 D-aminoacylase [Deltaproteobacteria bacterium]
MANNIIIKNGFVVDGTGDKGYYADIEITGDKIVHLSKTSLSVDEFIDASGMVVAPGFIDVHSHSDYHILLNPYAESKVRQGVTTEVNGNCGYSITPVDGIIMKERQEQYYTSYGLKLNIKSISDYVELVNSQGTSLNILMLIGHGTLRGSVMGRKAEQPTDKDMQTMKSLVRQSMEQGASGISTGLAYTPGAYAKTDEVIELAKVVKEYNGIYATHMRSEGSALLESIEEAVTIGREAGLPVEISHLKTMYPENWKKIDRAFEIIENAKKSGIDVDADRYPYISAYTGLASVMPDWVYADSTEMALRRLGDRSVRNRIENELKQRHEDMKDYFSRIMLSQCFVEEDKRFEGMYITDIAKKLNIEPIEVVYQLLIKEGLMTTAIYFAMSEDNLKRIITKPYVSIGSDAGLRADYGPLYEGKPHPRSYGTYPRVFSDFVKTGLLTLEQAVYKMTSMPAEKMKLKKRGQIKEGWYADIVIFSPERMQDDATYKEPHVYPQGIHTVIVNGDVVINKGIHTKQLPGKILKWMNTF